LSNIYIHESCKLYFYLDNTIPACRDNDGIRVIGRETHTANPVCVPIILDGVFALGQCIPQFNRLVSWTWDNL